MEVVIWSANLEWWGSVMAWGSKRESKTAGMISKNESVAAPTSTGTHGVRTWTWTLESCRYSLCTLEHHGSNFPEGVLVNGSKPIKSVTKSFEDKRGRLLLKTYKVLLRCSERNYIDEEMQSESSQRLGFNALSSIPATVVCLRRCIIATFLVWPCDSS